MTIGGPYPTLPLQDAPPRAPSVFSQHSSACSPTASFTGPFNPPGVVSPQPHSSYYSGMTGPQHPFYNRVSLHPSTPLPQGCQVYTSLYPYLKGVSAYTSLYPYLKGVGSIPLCTSTSRVSLSIPLCTPTSRVSGLYLSVPLPQECLCLYLSAPLPQGCRVYTSLYLYLNGVCLYLSVPLPQGCLSIPLCTSTSRVCLSIPLCTPTSRVSLSIPLCASTSRVSLSIPLCAPTSRMSLSIPLCTSTSRMSVYFYTPLYPFSTSRVTPCTSLSVLLPQQGAYSFLSFTLSLPVSIPIGTTTSPGVASVYTPLHCYLNRGSLHLHRSVFLP